MGQTLTHGVYLPDEGERNCYNGLAANWQILDSSVGTIAEHTSALAGKAPLVHTHTKSDITDFPAYGNTAGTICEGNDSRLSDARTPVAHTHTKADITDLFNSANTWTGNNTFSNFITSKESAAISAGGYGKGIAFRDYQNNRLGYIQPYLTSDNAKRLVIGADSGDIASNSNLIPNTNNSVNLGSSSYQWNNLYAKNYYYNGVAWGLDKANVWSANQTIASGSNDQCYYVKDTVYELGQNYSNGEHLGGLTIHDKNGSTVGLLDIVDRSYGNMEMRIRVQQKFDPNSNNRSTSGDTLFNEMILGITPTKTNYIGFNADLWGNNTYNLGTASSKWKTLNGINPGALSLPKGYTEEGADKHYINIASVIQTLDGTLYYYTMPDNGWISVRAEQANQVHVTTDNWKFGQSIYSNTATTLIVSTPFRKGDTVAIKVIATTLEHARFYPMQGNV